jgi:broad specificity phosphatase PhoE
MKRLIFWAGIILFSASSLSSCYTTQRDVSREITTVFLVRHAEKLKSKDKDPELNELGQKRAQLLSTMLSNSEIDVIYSTDYKRTRNTAAPLAELIDKKVQIYNPGDKEFINNLLIEHKGKKILITGHSNTTPALVNQLIGEAKYDQLDENEYSKLFMVTLDGSTSKVSIITY